jgi:hypothetical protein
MKYLLSSVIFILCFCSVDLFYGSGNEPEWEVVGSTLIKNSNRLNENPELDNAKKSNEDRQRKEICTQLFMDLDKRCCPARLIHTKDNKKREYCRVWESSNFALASLTTLEPKDILFLKDNPHQGLLIEILPFEKGNISTNDLVKLHKDFIKKEYPICSALREFAQKLSFDF